MIFDALIYCKDDQSIHERFSAISDYFVIMSSLLGVSRTGLSWRIVGMNRDGKK